MDHCILKVLGTSPHRVPRACHLIHGRGGIQSIPILAVVTLWNRAISLQQIGRFQTHDFGIGPNMRPDKEGTGNLIKITIFQCPQTDDVYLSLVPDLIQRQTGLLPGLSQLVSDLLPHRDHLPHFFTIRLLKTFHG